MKNIPVRRIKTTDREPDFSKSFSIRSIKDVLGGKGLVQDLHRHDFFLVMVIEKGKGIHEIDFIVYEVGDYSIFFMRPGQVHQLDLKAGSTGYIMQFSTGFYYPDDRTSAQLLRKVSHKNYCQLDARRTERLFDLLKYISEEHAKKEEGYQEIIKANLRIFFIECIRHRQNGEAGLISKGSNYTQERMEELLNLLETHIYTKKQVSDYAAMLNLSPYQLNSITKTSLGKSCSELINEHIILESKRFLLATSNQVSQIADKLGYDDVSYYIRFFKKHTGYSPEMFRNKLK